MTTPTRCQYCGVDAADRHAFDCPVGRGRAQLLTAPVQLPTRPVVIPVPRLQSRLVPVSVPVPVVRWAPLSATACRRLLAGAYGAAMLGTYAAQRGWL